LTPDNSNLERLLNLGFGDEAKQLGIGYTIVIARKDMAAPTCTIGDYFFRLVKDAILDRNFPAARVPINLLFPLQSFSLPKVAEKCPAIEKAKRDLFVPVKISKDY
jgi:hypothetical protein